MAVAAGLSVQPGTPPPPVVQAYLDRLERDGVNWRFWLGQVLTGPLCAVDGNGQGGSCIVFTTTQVLRYPLGSTDPGDVHPDLGHQMPRP